MILDGILDSCSSFGHSHQQSWVNFLLFLLLGRPVNLYVCQILLSPLKYSQIERVFSIASCDLYYAAPLNNRTPEIDLGLRSKTNSYQKGTTELIIGVPTSTNYLLFLIHDRMRNNFQRLVFDLTLLELNYAQN